MKSVRIGRPPRAPFLVRAGRAVDRAGGYFAAVLVVATVTWFAPGRTAPLVFSLLLASVVCGPRRPKTGSPRVRVFARARGLRPTRRMWRLRRPMPGVTTLPPVGG